MKDDNCTIPGTKMQKKQNECKNRNKVNSIKIIFVKIVNHPITQAFIALLVMYLMIVLAPQIFVLGAMQSNNNNATIANLYITSQNGLLIAFLTFIYILLTQRLVIQSKEAIAQSKKEQQIRDIEHRLKNFYLPAIDTINDVKELGDELIHFVFIGYNTEIGENSKITIRRKGFDEISKYRYLAETKTLEKFEDVLVNKIKLIENKKSLVAEIENLKKLLETDIGIYKKTLKDLKK